MKLISVSLLALLFSGGVFGADQEKSFDHQPVDNQQRVTYSVSVYHGNDLVWQEDVQADVDHVTDVVIAPKDGNGVGVVGYVWPQSSQEGVTTRFVLDADWAKNPKADAEVTLRAEDSVNLSQVTADNLNQNIHVEQDDYQLILVQKSISP